MAVLSLKGISTSSSLRVGGDDMDAAIVRYLRTKYNLIIGARMAESIKKAIGAAIPPEDNPTMQAKGRDALTGLPAVRPVTAWEIGEALSEPLMEMLSGVQRVLETTPPELAGDVMEHGMVLTGRRREAGRSCPVYPDQYRRFLPGGRTAGRMCGRRHGQGAEICQAPFRRRLRCRPVQLSFVRNFDQLNANSPWN